MPRPIVIAYHLIWTAYGCWLPNDPRGSTSRTVRSGVLAGLGPHYFGRRKTQPPGSIIREFYDRARDVLKFPLLKMSAADAAGVAEAFAYVVAQSRYTCYACAIMPDHVHIVIRKHRDNAEQMIENLQESSRLRLSALGLRTPDHPVWTSGGWKGFLDNQDEVRKKIAYVESNPPHMGLPEQRWGFVTPYDGWPLRPGHSPNSPYARRLKKG
jgi:REP element-mobilizing transposase RayT